MFRYSSKLPNFHFGDYDISTDFLSAKLLWFTVIKTFVMVQRKISGLKRKWGTVDAFLHFQPLLLYFMSKQAQNLSHNKATLYTKYNAKTLKQRPSEKISQPI